MKNFTKTSLTLSLLIFSLLIGCRKENVEAIPDEIVQINILNSKYNLPSVTGWKVTGSTGGTGGTGARRNTKRFNSIGEYEDFLKRITGPRKKHLFEANANVSSEKAKGYSSPNGRSSSYDCHPQGWLFSGGATLGSNRGVDIYASTTFNTMNGSMSNPSVSVRPSGSSPDAFEVVNMQTVVTPSGDIISQFQTSEEETIHVNILILEFDMKSTLNRMWSLRFITCPGGGSWRLVYEVEEAD